MSSFHSPSVDASAYAPSDDAVHNGEAWCTVADDDPWAPVILTLDGGGIRGYASLLLLQAVMHEVAVWEHKLDKEAAMNGHVQSPLHNEVLEPNGYGNGHGNGQMAPKSYNEDNLLPCHYFDFMYGTSTGGLIATMLGRLRMTVPQCLAVYRVVGQDLFGRRRSYGPLATKYHHQPLEAAVKEIVKTYCKQHPGDDCDGDDWFPWAETIDAKDKEEVDLSHLCQAVCLTAVRNGRIDEAHLLRTYDHRYTNIPNWITPYNEGAAKLRIWQVTRATSAAPFYFKPLNARVHGEEWVFKDGGIRENNPAGAAWSEFVSLYGEGKEPAVLLSIGTGKPNEMNNDGFAASWPGPFGKSTLVKRIAEKFAVLKNVLVKYTEGESTHRDMLRLARGEAAWYKRLNVSQGLETLPLDDWRRGSWTDPATGKRARVAGGATLTAMHEATAAYLAREHDVLADTYAAPRVMVAQMAQKLVRQRRARAAAASTDAGAGAAAGPDAAAAAAPDAGAATGAATSVAPVADQRRWDTYTGHYLAASGARAGAPDGPVQRPPPRER